MKKILFLLLIFVIKLSAYDYLYNRNPTSNNEYIEYFYYDSDGILKIKSERDGVLINPNNAFSYNGLGYISTNYSDFTGIGYINRDMFFNYLKNDLQFLNDWYEQKTNYILNFFYNSGRFNDSNYILYNDYELLYNSDGLAVESIVGGVWAGLYPDSQKSKSGALYDKSGSMIYYNGKAVTATTSFLVWLDKFTNKVVIETFEEIQRSLVAGIIAAVVLVLAVVRLVLELLPFSITPRRRRYYGGGRGSLPDYGDGRQVAASVRARLAAKNRALKARAYDRSSVEQSTVNGILFDLENER